jgi:ABC-type proline/glycine betaine transport system permease subunit
MAKMQNYRIPQKNRPVINRKKKQAFRWSVVLVPLVCLFVFWVVHNIKPAFSWSQVLNLLHVKNRERFTMLTVLGLLLIGIVSIWSVLRKNDDD